MFCQKPTLYLYSSVSHVSSIALLLSHSGLTEISELLEKVTMEIFHLGLCYKVPQSLNIV